MSVPEWYELLLLGLGAWRMFHLLAYDDILDRPRRYVTRLDPRWQKEGDPTGDRYREGLAEFIQCPFCLGFWVALGWWAAWEAWPDTLIVAVPFALSALVVGAQQYLSSEE